MILDGVDKTTDLGLDSLAYDYIPEGYPLTDERKARVTIGHLLSMTGGFIGGDPGDLGRDTYPAR